MNENEIKESLEKAKKQVEELDKYFETSNQETSIGEHLYSTNVLLNILINVIENKN